MVAVLRKVKGGLGVKEHIISWGLDAPAKFAPTLEVRKGIARYREASKLWKDRSAYNPWTHISHKELTCLLQKST